MVLAIPPEGQVDVWMAEVLDLAGDQRRACEAMLNAEERARLAKFAVEQAGTQFLAARCLLRTVLSVYLPGQPREWDFTANAFGRPRLCDGQAATPLHFNLSHTRGMVVCALSRTEEVGVDVEWAGRDLNYMSLAKAAFAPSEIAALGASRGVDERELFFSFWTLKESYIKARGMGMSLPLQAFWFELNGGAAEIFFSAELADSPSRWSFGRFSPTASHRMAVAASFSSIRSAMQVNLRTVEMANLSAIRDTPSSMPEALVSCIPQT